MVLIHEEDELRVSELDQRRLIKRLVELEDLAAARLQPIVIGSLRLHLPREIEEGQTRTAPRVAHRMELGSKALAEIAHRHTHGIVPLDQPRERPLEGANVDRPLNGQQGYHIVEGPARMQLVLDPHQGLAGGKAKNQVHTTIATVPTSGSSCDRRSRS